ncbi:MAG: hypothetical protein ACO2O5_02310 [Candidatus Caldipriscus sp.]
MKTFPLPPSQSLPYNFPLMKIKLTEEYLEADSWARERAKTLLPQN